MRPGSGQLRAADALRKLTGERDGQFAIAINDQWHICFRFEQGDAYDVEVTDYHRG